MRSSSIVGLALLMVVSLPRCAAATEDAGEWLGRITVDFGFEFTIHLPWDRSNAEGPCGRVMAVPDVAMGERIPLPRNADGSCPVRAQAELSDSLLPLTVEFEPEGCLDVTPPTCTHWIQHGISTTTSESIDDENCEVVIDMAIARDDIRRTVLRPAPPELIELILGQLPAPDDRQ